MLDIKFIRENPDLVKENIRKKFQNAKLPLVDEVIALDSERREAINEGDIVSVNFDTGVITDVTKGESWQAAAFPPFIQNIIKAGGLLKSLKEREA